ncbi:NUDIX hydrolase [Flavilitoribacter nigricans DSM 23189 = NBRC 102662]|uniref:NUDIX hydrolase n=1 Tax=Flavilitoribacter nigricans (strain ATCC 23147 / DSM 23189 / NBRC 102662 / NCIMB 1420 / SS-2) TaxID=1122177 RepID=A0A2D0MZC8_FLAN2|nr:NUDIX hydrolase [Flavilitoribacter nigricans DSM 23189 = NBRC 102662]
MRASWHRSIKSLVKIFLRTLGQLIPSDVFAPRFPVSVKGVCFIEEKVILLKNERDEWDLPGGKLKKRETVPDCLVREIEEELSILVQPHQLLKTLTIRVMNTVDVFIVIYSCLTTATIDQLRISEESFAIGTFTVEELDGIILPQAYKDTIRQAHKELV